MAQSAHPITYHYDCEGHAIEVTRVHVGTAYARNGNVGNPTEYFQWESTVDGEWATGTAPTRTVAYEYARAKALGIPYSYDEGMARRSKNVRAFWVVQTEMKANCRRHGRPRTDTDKETP